VEFTSLSSGDVQEYNWDFDNDGFVESSEENPSYEFPGPGDYTVKLTVKSDDGSDTYEEEVSVSSVPPYFELTIQGTNSPIEATDSLNVDLKIKNTGGNGAQDIELLDQNGNSVTSNDIYLRHGESTSISDFLTWNTDSGDTENEQIEVVPTGEGSGDTQDIEIVPLPPEIQDVQTDSDAVETDEEMTITAEVDEGEILDDGGEIKDGLNPEVEYSVDGQGTFKEDLHPSLFQPGNSDKIFADIPAYQHDIGTEITYNITVKNDLGNATTSDEYTYFSFKKVDEVAVVFAKFDSISRDELEPVNLDEDLEEYQNNLSRDINEYYASSNGSMGGIGFNFTFFDNSNQWYTVEPISTYVSTLGALSQSSFISDAIDEADIERRYQYDTVAAVSSGNSDQISDLSPDLGPIHYAPWKRLSPSYSRIYLVENSIFNRSQAIHELAHTQGIKELYDDSGLLTDSSNPGGDIGKLGVMAKSYDIPPPRFSAIGRTRFAKFSDAPDSVFDEWLSPSLRETYGDIVVSELSSKEYGDSVRGFYPDINQGEEDFVDRKFVLEANDGSSRRFSDFERGVYIYTYTVNDDGPETIDIMNYNVDLPSLDSVPEPNLPDLRDTGTSTEYDMSPDGYAKFVLEGVSGTGEGYTADVSVEDPGDESEQTTTGTLQSNPLAYWNRSIGQEQEVGSTNNDTPSSPPSVDLHAYDEEGNHVGVNYSSGEYEVEIPDTMTSGPSGYEWISVPDKRTVSYSVDTRRVQEFINRTDSVEWENENTSSTYTFSVADYGDNPEVVSKDGKSVIANTTVVRKRSRSVDPGIQSEIGLAADVNHEPDTLNLGSEGAFVEVIVNSTPGGVDLTNVNLSSVMLNEEVGAVTNPRYGFVRNPVENGTLNLKFLRDEVGDVLETGKEVPITVTGETTEDEIFVGSDSIEVINEPSNGTGPPECLPENESGEGPGERIGPPEETPGIGPGEGPGERVGPPEETPGIGPREGPRESSNCSLNDGNNPGEEENTSTPEDEVEERRAAGRGDSPTEDDRREAGRSNENAYPETDGRNRDSTERSGKSRGS